MTFSLQFTNDTAFAYLLDGMAALVSLIRMKLLPGRPKMENYGCT